MELHFFHDKLFTRPALHDPAISKDQYQQLYLKDDQWGLLEQLTKVLKPLKMATTVFGYE